MPKFSMTLVRCDCQFTVSFPTRICYELFLLVRWKGKSLFFAAPEKKKGFFYPPHIRYLVFSYQSYVILINPRRVGPNFQITFCYTRNVSVLRDRFRTLWSCEGCVTLRLLAHHSVKKEWERDFSRNKFLICATKGLRKGSEIGDKEWWGKTIRVEKIR